MENDVNTQTDTTTGGDSSSTQKTPAVNDTTQDTSGTQTVGDKTVPYDRFKEVNDNFRRTQDELKAIRQGQESMQQQFVKSNQPQQPAEVQQAREQLKGLLKDIAPELGFINKQELEQREQINEVARTESSLGEKYNGKNGLPKYDAQKVREYALANGYTNAKHLEVAYKQMHEAEIMNARIQAALTQNKGVRSELSNGTGSANAGVSDADLMKAAQSGDQSAIQTLIARRRKA